MTLPGLLMAAAFGFRLFESLVVLGVLVVGMMIGAAGLAVVWFRVTHGSIAAIWAYAMNFMWHSELMRHWLRPDKRGVQCPRCGHTEVMDPDSSPADIVEI